MIVGVGGFTCGVAEQEAALACFRMVLCPNLVGLHFPDVFDFILFLSYFLLFKPPLLPLPLPHTLPLPAPPLSILISISGKLADYFSNSSESKPQIHPHVFLRSPNFLVSFVVSLVSFYIVLVIKLGERHFYFLSSDTLII